MPRQRTGTLEQGQDGIYKARVTVLNPDGSTSRPWYSLGTTDAAIAKRKLARLLAELAAGRGPDAAAQGAASSDRVADYAEAWLKKREAQGVVMVTDERRQFDLYILKTIGKLPLCDVKPAHVRNILDAAVAAGKKWQTVVHIRAAMHRMFDAAWREEIIESNPVARVRVPPMREVKKERAILTDEEIARYFASDEADLELPMLSLVARCEGGMRTGDLNAWNWTMLDLDGFTKCVVPRAKTKTPQELEVPEVLRPFLRAWWERQGSPKAGPVFPARKGQRAGGFKAKRGNSYADRLRRDLFRAGVLRLPPVEVPATKQGTRSDLGKRAEGKKLAPNPGDPLYFETATSLPVDFHSFRPPSRAHGRQDAHALRDEVARDDGDPRRGAPAPGPAEACEQAHIGQGERIRIEPGNRPRLGRFI